MFTKVLENGQEQKIILFELAFISLDSRKKPAFNFKRKRFFVNKFS